MALLDGRGGCLRAQNGGFWPGQKPTLLKAKASDTRKTESAGAFRNKHHYQSLPIIGAKI
jgi:hypothetical protein